MAHPQQQQFCLSVKDLHPAFFTGARVLECGSRNINGTIRDLFTDCDYTGIDCMPGECVDEVCLAHEYQSDKPFDVVCSTEMLEHDPHATFSVARMLSLLRPGGLLFITCAGPGRAEHGTVASGDVWGPQKDYYCNASLQGLLNLVSLQCDRVYGEYNPGPCDVYIWGIKTLKPS